MPQLYQTVYASFSREEDAQFALSTLQATGQGILEAVYTGEEMAAFPLSFPNDYLSAIPIAQQGQINIRVRCLSGNSQKVIRTLASLGADSVKSTQSSQQI